MPIDDHALSAAARTEPRHIGSYPRHHALWHLERLGVVRDLIGFASPDAWALPAQDPPARVALIDTGIARDHPCLTDAVDAALALDLSTHDHGLFAVPAADLTADQPARRAQVLARAAAHAGDDFAGRFCRDLDDADRVTLGYRPAANRAFADHGTAMAGLIGARPVAHLLLHRPAELAPAHRDAGEDAAALPYAGIDPRCTIVPITLAADPDPVAMHAALVYADLIEADMIVFAASLPDPARATIGTGPAGRYAQSSLDAEAVPHSPQARDRWNALHDAVVAASLKRPILCAAGNGADGMVAYPALLAAPDNGIVAVGARTAAGARATYSAGDGSGQPATLYTLSGDGPSVTARGVVVDVFAVPSSADARLVETRPGARAMAVEALVTTDIPGPAGYEGSDHPPVWRPKRAPGDPDVAMDFAAFFATFGGTSAATAVAGGLLALGYTTGNIARGTDPVALKARLIAGQPDDPARGLPMLDWQVVRGT